MVGLFCCPATIFYLLLYLTLPKMQFEFRAPSLFITKVRHVRLCPFPHPFNPEKQTNLPPHSPATILLHSFPEAAKIVEQQHERDY
jgi:hypothetical protein